MNRYAVLSAGFEHLSYSLSVKEAKDGGILVDRGETFMLHSAASASEAEMAVVASDSLSQHASLPVGFFADSENRIFLVCRTKGRLRLSRYGHNANPLPESCDERICIGKALIKRLAILHTIGFGCGGISPDSVEFSAGEARLLNPSKVFALSDGDSPYYEAVATLRSIYGSRLASKSELLEIARDYVSHSPVCRHAVASHLLEKGSNAPLAQSLCEHALRFSTYF